MIAVLPFIIFLETTGKVAEFLKKKNIYAHWDVWHSYIIVAIIIFIALWLKGYRLN